MIAIKIATAKIDKTHLYEGKTGKFLDVLLLDNKDGVDQYGNAGFVVQSVSKEAKARGEKGPIIGNWKHVGTKTEAKPAPKTESTNEDDVPF